MRVTFFHFIIMLTFSLVLGCARTNYAGENTNHEPDASIETNTDSNTDVDNGTGWLDPATGLVWEQPIQDDSFTWSAAEEHCRNLGKGKWRLPNIDELRSLLRAGAGDRCADSMTGGACGVTELGNDCLERHCEDECYSCSFHNGPGKNGCYWDPALTGWCDHFWSSSECPDCAGVGGTYWQVYFGDGDLMWESANSDCQVICVREATRDEFADADNNDGDTDDVVIEPGLIYGLVTVNDGQTIDFTATVSVWDTVGNPILKTRTHDQGEFEISVPPGVYSVKAEAPGYWGDEHGVKVDSGAKVKVVIDII